MRKNLPPRIYGHFLWVVPFAFPSLVQAASFTRCEPKEIQRDCIPGSTGGAGTLVNNDTINISKAAGAGNAIAFNWPVRNCNDAAGQLRGQVMVIVDNSKSEATTDVGNLRAGVVMDFLEKFASKSNAASSGVASNDPSAPKLSVMNYNGRSGTQDTSQKIDDLNFKFDPDYCVKTTDTFPSANASSRWDQTSGGSKLSICEFLPFDSGANSSAVANMKNFVDFATDSPRGSTDFTYFFKGSLKAFGELANPNNVGRNVVVVTDGLPNVPKNVAGATCAASARLSREPRKTEFLVDKVQEYCVDRQAPASINAAHTEALTTAFSEINVHHLLFAQDERAYFDYDDSGSPSLNPAGFLIENSARTGNGKVKFGFAKNKTDLTAAFDDLLLQFDKNALRYVKVEVTPAGSSALPPYNAVTPSAPLSTFDIKFIGLKTGTNVVKVTPVYQDGRSADSITVNVVVGGTTDTDMKCSEVADGKTVDGDQIGSTDPAGDGFYAEPLPSGQYRDYRNADQGNRLAGDFGVVGVPENKQDLTKLRLQGGTGNCGNVAASAEGDRSSGTLAAVFGLLCLPLLVVRRIARRSAQRSETRRS
ncbi:MAG: hypothetical protein EBR09_10315 [Proteobacteria bacterium]|nr:hypothetical protein [Pseudomonadota bacterium]